jgi:hypothetical protein
MKLTATVIGERIVTQNRSHMDFGKTEPYALADVLVTGDNMLIAATLRAMADALDPPSEALADWERDLLQRDAIERRMRLVEDTT